MYKKIVCVLIGVCFLLIGTAAVAANVVKPAATATQPAADIVKQPGTPKPQIFLCPSGWHKVKKTNEEFKCAPNKPVQVTCPEGWTYVEELDCKSYAGIGTQVTCSGCEVGCVKKLIIQ